MSLSANVDALLEVYSKCLGLLHVFGDSKESKTIGAGAGAGAAPGASRSSSSAVPSHHSPPGHSRDAASDWDRQSRLSRSLHSDRAKVREVFSSRLSESGAHLAKGDTRSRSALRRIVNRLTKVLSGIFSIGTKGTYSGHADGRPLLNYDALRALSKSSRVGAIHAIDDLSVRLKHKSASRVGSKSGHSVVSTRSAKSGRTVENVRSARLSKASPSSIVAASRAAAHTPPAIVSSAPSTGQRSKNSKTKEQQSQQQALADPSSSSATKKTSSSHGAGKSKASSKSSATTSKANSSTSAGRSKSQDPTTKPSKPKEKGSSKKKGDQSKMTSSEASKSQGPGHNPRYTQASTQTNNRAAIDSIASTTSTARAGPLHTELRIGSGSTSSPLPKHSARPISMLSSSSASTRLGEIPEHKLRRRNMVPEPQDGAVGPQESFEYYNISVAYPMRPLWIPEEDQADAKGKKKQKEEKRPEEKKKHFWGRGRA